MAITKFNKLPEPKIDAEIEIVRQKLAVKIDHIPSSYIHTALSKDLAVIFINDYYSHRGYQNRQFNQNKINTAYLFDFKLGTVIERENTKIILEVYPYPRLNGVILVDHKGNITLWNLRLTKKVANLIKSSDLNSKLDNNQTINSATVPTLSFFDEYLLVRLHTICLIYEVSSDPKKPNLKLKK